MMSRSGMVSAKLLGDVGLPNRSLGLLGLA
jgi:hypothetical protein